MDKPAVVFLPALLCDERLWSDQLRTLSEIADCHVADLTQDDSMPALAARVLEHAPDQFALVGSSMGGYVAFEVLRQAPERVTGLVLIGTTAAADDATKSAGRRKAIERTRQGDFQSVISDLLPKLSSQYECSEETRRVLHAMADDIGPDAFTRQQTAILNRIEASEVIAAYTRPMTLIFGEQDVPTPPSEGENLQRLASQAELHIVKDCGHLASLNQPQFVSQLIAHWLNG